MLFLMGFICALFFISLNPLTWITDLKEKSTVSIVLKQVSRFILGAIWSWIGIYFVLIDLTFSGFIIWWGLPISILLLIDGYFLKDNCSKDSYSTVGKVQLILGIILCVAYVGMITIYPASTMKGRYNYVKDFVTVEHSNIPATNTDNIGIVSAKTAKRTGSMVVPEFGNASLYEDGTYSKQVIKSETEWVSPIEFESNIKALGDKIAPGYVTVNSNNPNEKAEVVKDEYKYMPSAVFSKDLARHVHFAFPTKIVIDSWFQVDDNNKGYWIVAIGHKEFFRFLNVQDSIVVVDPVTGEMQEYANNKAPTWIENVISGEIAESYGNIYGGNSRGFWSRYFAPVDQFKLTTWTWKVGEDTISGDDAWSIIVDANNEMWYTSDCENLNDSNKSILGYMMISARTGKITYYDKVRGVNGKAFGENATQIFKEKTGWYPVEPTIYTIFDEITWYSTIIDENGQIQKYVMGPVSNGKVAIGDTFDGVTNAYKKLLSEEGIINAPSSSSEDKKVSGKVVRVIAGDTTKILIQDNDKIFVIDSITSPYAQFTQIGDEVEISYGDTNDITVYVNKYYNKSLNK